MARTVSPVGAWVAAGVAVVSGAAVSAGAAVGAARLAAGSADESDSLRPLYVARPSLGPTPGPSGMGAVRP